MKKSVLLLLALSLAPRAFAQEAPERVVMPLDEFLKLYETTKDRKEEEKAPRDWAIASASYDGEIQVVDGEPTSALFKGRFRVDVLKAKGWTRVPLLPASVAIRSAKVGAEDAALTIESGWYWLVTDRHDAFDVNIDFAAAVFSSEGRSGLSFELPQSGSTSAVVRVPSSEALDFTVTNARYQSDRVDGRFRVVEATVPATGSLAVTWQRELPEAAVPEEPLVYAEVNTLVGIGDGLLEATSTIQHTILFAPVDQLSVAIPKDMTILDVQGTGVRDWTLGEDGVLVVQLNYAAEGSYPLTLQLEKVVGEGDLSLDTPLPRPVNVERSKGFVGVEARGNLEIGAGTVRAATPVDVRSLPAAILGITGQPVLLGYKYLGTDATIPLQVTQHDDIDVLVTLLDQTRATTMWTVDGRRLTSVRYQVRNNRKQFLRLALPEGAEVWTASVGGRAVQPAKAGDGRVLVPLIRSKESGGSLAAFDVEIVYVESGDAAKGGKGTFEATLPTPDVPSTYVAWTVYSPEDAKVPKSSLDGSLRDVEYLSNPISSSDVYYIQTATPAVVSGANAQTTTGGLGEGAVPVPVALPLEGTPRYFEKLLALDERLWVRFDFKGMK